jgi:single stranded DNA-binding protein
MKNNQITIVGNVGKSIEEKTFEDGNCVTNFSLAHTVNQKDTEWFYVNAYEELGAKVLKEVTKGARIKVTGSLRVQRFQKKDGSGQDCRLVIRLESYDLLPREVEVEIEARPKRAKRSAA